jgi:hypothetical protein
VAENPRPRLAQNRRFSLFFKDFKVIMSLGFSGPDPGRILRQAA